MDAKDREECKTDFFSLKDSGFSVHLIFFKRRSPKDENELIDLINEIDPLLIGLSVRSIDYKDAKRISQKIKRNSDAFLIWGGTHPTICPEDSIKYADAICRGDGIRPTIELANKLKNNEKIDRIPNLWVKRNSEVIKNEISYFDDLNNLPFPDFSTENLHFIGTDVKEFELEDKTSYPILTRRGCPMSCSYCNMPTMRNMIGKNILRQRSVERVIRELQHAKQVFPNLSFVYFWDDIFPQNKQWVDRFCKEYKEKIELPSLYISTHRYLIKKT